MNDTPSVMNERSAGVSLSAPLLTAVAAGALWTLVPLLRGIGLLEWGILLAGASFTQWLGLVMVLAFRRQPARLASVWWTAVLALPLVVLIALVIFARTHHRPLGAVTFASLSGGVIVLAMLLERRLGLARFWSPAGSRWAVGSLAGVLLGSAWWVGGNETLLEGAIGAVLLLASSRLVPPERLERPTWAGRAGLAVLLLACCTLVAAAPGMLESAGKSAPIILGLWGCLR